MNTVDEANELIEKFEELQRMAAPVAEKIFELENNGTISIDFEEITVESGSLYANFTEYGRCGHEEHHSIHIPTEYLFDDTWIKKSEEKIDDERKMKIRLAMKREERERQEALYRDHKRYLELKDKFEGDGL